MATVLDRTEGRRDCVLNADDDQLPGPTCTVSVAALSNCPN